MRRAALLLPALLALPALVALSACGGDDGDTRTAAVLREDLIVHARTSGELRAVESRYLVVPPATRRLQIARLVEDGKSVDEGEVLVMFDPNEFQKQLRDKQADLNSATKEVEKSQLDARGELERLRVDLERTRVELEKARVRAAGDPSIVSRVDLAKARADIKALEVGELEKGRAVALARERHQKQEQSLLAKIRNAEEAVKLAQTQLMAMTLKAPVAGTALLEETWNAGSRRKFQVGDPGWTGQPIVSLPDLDRMEALLYVEEADISRVSIGQPVIVRLDAAPDREFVATVTSIPPLAESLSWFNPAKVFRVVASLDQTDPDLMRPGLRLQAEIEVDRHESVVTVPLEAVVERDGETWLELESGERLEVALGVRNDDRVIVTDGLSEGDQVRLRLREES